MKTNRRLFSDTAFRERLKDNPCADALAIDRAIKDNELEAELTSVSDSDPLVSKLIGLRDTVIFHTAADKVMKDAPQAWLPINDVEILLDRARAITSKYSLLYKASMSGGLAGADDYLRTLQCLRRALREIDCNASQVDGNW